MTIQDKIAVGNIIRVWCSDVGLVVDLTVESAPGRNSGTALYRLCSVEHRKCYEMSEGELRQAADWADRADNCY